MSWIDATLDDVLGGWIAKLRAKRERDAAALAERLERLDTRNRRHNVTITVNGADMTAAAIEQAREHLINRTRELIGAPRVECIPTHIEWVAGQDGAPRREHVEFLQRELRVRPPNWERLADAGERWNGQGMRAGRRLPRDHDRFEWVEGVNMGSYAAELERSDVFGGGGFSLRVVRREGGICGQLASMQWEQLEDGALPTYALASPDAGGDMAAFLQAIMDASWRAGLRPTSYSVEDTSSTKTLESLKAHIAGLERQVNMQHQYIEKLLAK